MALKRGKLAPKEQEFIRANINTYSPKQMALHLNRSEEVIVDFLKKENISYINISEETFEDVELEKKLRERVYYKEVQKQLSPEELLYFVATWIHLIKQFRNDVLYSEELSIKQWIMLEIMGNRSQEDKLKTIKQIKSWEEALDREYAKPTSARDDAKIATLESDIALLRSSTNSYTTEYAKIMEKIKDITKELKAARADRVKRIEDSKSSFAGFLNALEDEDLRAKIGEDAEIMRLAKDKTKQKLGEFHKFEDGQIDQPLLTPENAKEDVPDDE